MRKTKKQANRKPAKPRELTISWVLFGRMTYRPHITQVDFADPEKVVAFRRGVMAEQLQIVDASRNKPVVPTSDVKAYFGARFAGFDCPVTRSLYKIGMVYSLEDAFGIGGALGILRKALSHLLRKMEDPHLLGYCVVAVARFATQAYRYKEAIKVCRDAIDRLKLRGLEPYCLPEIYRLLAVALHGEYLHDEAIAITRRAEVEASRRSYYMPALWNRIYRTRANILDEKAGEGPRKELGECLEHISRNEEIYGEQENCDALANDRLYWLMRVQPTLRTADN
jgi:tetratricopeptide (TPR) repeat protein